MSLYTLYLDDSQWGEGKNKPKYMVLGGLIIEESSEDILVKNLSELKEKANLDRFDPIKFNPPRDYEQKTKIKDQNKFRKEVISLITSSRSTLMAAYYAGTKEINPTKMAFQLINDLAIRFYFFLQYETPSQQPKPRGSIVLAYPGKDETAPFSDFYHEIRKKSATLHSKNWDNPGNRPISLNSLEPALYFSYEKHNPLIQVADYIAGSVASALKQKNNEYFDTLKPRFRTQRDTIKGAGLMAYPHYTPIMDELCKNK